jgi:hypothetical protein
MRGRTIKLYIMGTEYKNLKAAELSNWTGKAFIGERKHVKLIQTIDELSVPGVYFLLKESNSEIIKNIYIGEADEVNKRLNNHFTQKDWWDDFIIFISKDTSLTKAHVRWLENKLFEIAKSNPSTIIVENNVIPSGSKLPASDIDDMNEFLDNLIFILDNLGIIDFTKTSEKEEIVIDKIDNVFYLNLTTERVDENNKILQGKLIITLNGYRLLTGSYIEKDERMSFSKHSYYPLRKQFENEEYFEDSKYDGCFILKKDIDFTSSSAAAAVVKNRAVNGPKEWHLINGKNLDDYENEIDV